MNVVHAEAKELLARLADVPDDAIDLADAALTLAALDHPRRDRQRYRTLLAAMTAAVGEAGAAAETADQRAGALSAVLAGRFRLLGDDDDDPLDGANLMQVLERRRGPAPSLGLLWLHVGRDQGWPVEALAFPGMLLLRVSGAAGDRAIVDPFGGGRCLDAAALRDLLKAVAGVAAELQPAHYATLSNREILLRLQTHTKLRYLRHAQLRRALETVQVMLLFAPGEIGLWREAGLMHLRQGNVPAAVAALEHFVAHAPNTLTRHRTSALLHDLRQRLI